MGESAADLRRQRESLVLMASSHLGVDSLVENAVRPVRTQHADEDKRERERGRSSRHTASAERSTFLREIRELEGSLRPLAEAAAAAQRIA